MTASQDRISVSMDSAIPQIGELRSGPSCLNRSMNAILLTGPTSKRYAPCAVPVQENTGIEDAADRRHRPPKKTNAPATNKCQYLSSPITLVRALHHASKYV